MPRAVWIAVALGLVAAPRAHAGPADPAGIRWERDLTEALSRSAQEGRPVLLCVNALENEGANIQLATVLYPSAAWGEATRGFLCLVANPNEHGSPAMPCSRYPGTRCSSHKEVLDLVARRFGPALISPQHLILEPDGDVAWRKEYFSGDVTPELLLGWFVRVAPRAAIQRAGLARSGEIASLEKGPLGEVAGRARAWLERGDRLAAAGIVHVLDGTDDAARRRLLLQALTAARGEDAPVLLEAADPYLVAPEDEPELTAAWVETLRTAIPGPAAPALARLAMRTQDAALRGRALGAVVEADPDLGRETRLLLGEREGAPPAEAPTPRLARALRRAGLVERAWPPLGEALSRGAPGPLRGALLEATAAEVARDRDRVVALLAGAREERVRLAAALALVGARIDPGDPGTTLLVDALGDPVEGEETRTEAVRRLGTDPGYAPEAWHAALRAAAGSPR